MIPLDSTKTLSNKRKYLRKILKIRDSQYKLFVKFALYEEQDRAQLTLCAKSQLKYLPMIILDKIFSFVDHKIFYKDAGNNV